MTDESPAQQLRALDDQMSQLVLDTIREDKAPPQGTQDPGWMHRTQDLLDVVSPAHLPHHFLRVVERKKLKVRRGLSFKSFMVQESESRRLGLSSTSWLLDQKLAAYRFIDELGVRRPAAELRALPFDELSLAAPMVVKPRRSTGSKGCYLITSESSIVHVQDGKHFTSLSAMRDHAHELMKRGKDGRALPDRWMSEELILEDRAAGTAASDLKYFCFYGEVLYILEVQRLDGRSKYSFRRPDGTPFIPGSWKYEYFDGQGTTDAQMEQARQISLQIPHPFCRIDMLRGEEELVFGEFTPRPGGFHRFSSEWDRRMGEAWARAQNRLERDLLAGKSFEPFVRATGVLEPDPTEPKGDTAGPTQESAEAAKPASASASASAPASAPTRKPAAKTATETAAPTKRRSLASRVAGAASRRLPFRGR